MVSREADADTLKKSYRKLAMQFHPDKNPGDASAEEKFKEAAEAYEILSHPEKRAQYDRFGHQAFQGGHGGGPQFTNVEDIFSNFGDIFSDFFGGNAGAGSARNQKTQGPRKGADLRYVLEINLKDVVSGVEREIEFETDDGCDTCQGSGAEKGTQSTTCGTCGGRGQVVRAQGFFSMASTCPTCRGQGSIVKNPCKSCRGEGRVRAQRKIKISIPAGVDSGTRLRVAKEGQGGYKGGPAGDLYAEILVKPHPQFERNGDDLYTLLKINYLHLMLGGQVEAPTLTGVKTLTIPTGTQVGDEIKLVNEGIPSLRGSRRGHVFYRVEVEFPRAVSKDEEKLLRELAKLRGLENVGSAASFWKRK